MAPRLAGPATANFGASQGYDKEAAQEDAAETAKGWWRLVWCHERCHKSQNEDSRQAIRSAVQDCGGSLICLKKARQFGLWMDRAPRPPYILATDWREAQPCMQIIAQSSGSNRPMVVVVVCEARRQLVRASEWAQGLPPGLGPVHVCERSSIPATLLDGLILRCFGPASSACADDQPQVHASRPTASGPPVPVALTVSQPTGVEPADAAHSLPAYPAPCAGSRRHCGPPAAVPKHVADGVPAFWSGSEDDAVDGSYAEAVRPQAYSVDIASTGTPSTAPFDEAEDLALLGAQGDSFPHVPRGCQQPSALLGQPLDAALLKFQGGSPGFLQPGVRDAVWRQSCLPPGRGGGGGPPPEPEMVPLPLTRLRLRL